MERRVARLGREEPREEEKQAASSPETDAPGREPPERARLPTMEREEEECRHANRQIRRVDLPRAHLAALVADAHGPGATAGAVEMELGREAEAARLVGPEVL